MAAYANPTEATNSLGSAFSPQTPEQVAAITNAASYVPINPNTAPTVNPGMLGTQPLNIQSSPTTPVPNISNIQPSTPTGTTPTAPAPGQTNTFTDKLSGLVAKFTGKATDKQIAETTATAPLEAQKSELSAQMKRLQADSLAQQEAATNRVGGTTETNGIDTNKVRRTNAIEGLLIQSRLDSLDGNIASAKANADLAIESKYAQIQQDIQNEKINIYNNWDTFNRAEKKRFSATLAQIDADDQFAKQNMEDEKAIQNMVIQAAQGGADNKTLDDISKSPDVATALRKAGKALGAEFAQKLKQQKFENDIALREIALKEKASMGNDITKVTADNLVQAMGSSKISATTKTTVGNILGVINAAESTAKGNPNGTIGGISPLNSVLDVKVPFTNIGLPFREALQSTSGTKNKAFINSINLRVQQWASGASLTKQQIDQVNKLVPTGDETDEKFKEKLNNLVNTMNDYIKGSLAAEGITYSPEPVDLWKPTTSLDDVFKL